MTDTDTDEDLGRAVGAMAGSDAGRSNMARTAKLVAESMKAAGVKSVATGVWLAEAVVDAVPHIPVRDAGTLSAQHGGLTGDRLAGEVVRAASHATAGFGAVAGALAGAREGVEAIPRRWLHALRDADHLAELALALHRLAHELPAEDDE